MTPRPDKTITITRGPLDGRPYYCIRCGLGFTELVACEEGGCQLESLAEAKWRQVEATTKDKADD